MALGLRTPGAVQLSISLYINADHLIDTRLAAVKIR